MDGTGPNTPESAALVAAVEELTRDIAELSNARDELRAELGEMRSAIVELTTTFADLGHQFPEQMDRLRAATKAAREDARRTLWMATVMSIAGIALVVIAGVSLAVNRSNTAVVDAIRSCTEPGGQCYDANQARSDARTAPLVSGIDSRIDRVHDEVCALFAPKDRPADCPH